VKPDVITLAKGLASGIPAAVVLVAPQLAARVAMNDHGSTFGGGPVAMAAMRATLEVIEQETLVENAARMGEAIVRRLAGLPGIKEIRGRGLLLGLELDRPAAKVQLALLEHLVVTGTSSAPNVLRLLPPLTIEEPEVVLLVDALREVLAHG
jgi:acetylornithine aminotransferase